MSRGRSALESRAVKKVALAALVLAVTLPVWAQAPEPSEPPPESPAKPKATIGSRFFFGGGIGIAFGSVDYLEIAPLVGFKVAPRLDLGLQPFYRWTNDGRYGTSV